MSNDDPGKLVLGSVLACVLAAGCSSGLFVGTTPGAGSNAGSDAGTSIGGAILAAPMPIISFRAPAFASGSLTTVQGPDKANDGDPGSTWVSDTLPAWIAYDLSSSPSQERGNVLVVWNAPHAGDYISATPQSFQQMPIDYTIETNAAPGGGSPPSSGWVQLVNVTGNNRGSRQHLVSLNASAWLRMSITSGSNPNVAIDLDVHSASSGASDSWMFMGDSITYMSLQRAWSDLPQLAHQLNAAYYPAVIDAAIGGTGSVVALLAIDETIKFFPGRFVALAYGTNDHPDTYRMEDLVLKVLAAGKTPVVPHMPWSDQKLVEGPLINQQIDALYLKYPQIVRGPDLWQAFLNRTDLIPPGDVHPNTAGQEELRKQWAQAMAKIYQ